MSTSAVMPLPLFCTNIITNPPKHHHPPTHHPPLNTDGRPLPTKKLWRTSSKACAPITFPHQQSAEGAVLTTTSQCEFRSLARL